MGKSPLASGVQWLLIHWYTGQKKPSHSLSWHLAYHKAFHFTFSPRSGLWNQTSLLLWSIFWRKLSSQEMEMSSYQYIEMLLFKTYGLFLGFFLFGVFFPNSFMLILTLWPLPCQMSLFLSYSTTMLGTKFVSNILHVATYTVFLLQNRWFLMELAVNYVSDLQRN